MLDILRESRFSHEKEDFFNFGLIEESKMRFEQGKRQILCWV